MYECVYACVYACVYECVYACVYACINILHFFQIECHVVVMFQYCPIETCRTSLDCHYIVSTVRLCLSYVATCVLNTSYIETISIISGSRSLTVLHGVLFYLSMSL